MPDLGLPAPLFKAVKELKFNSWMPIQQHALPWTLKGADCVGKAQTGTGKTATFLLTLMTGMLNCPLDSNKRNQLQPRAVVLAPTRELASQIGSDALNIGKYTSLNTQVVIGGVDLENQRQELGQAPIDILIATPGRLQDWVSRGYIDLARVEYLVLDEADRMVDMGFLPQVRNLVGRMPETRLRQTMLFSATVDFRIENIVRRWTHQPLKVEIEPSQITPGLIDQRIYTVSRQDKLRVLENLLSGDEIGLMIVFVNTRHMVKRIYSHLKGKGHAVGMLSGILSQNQRERTLEKFRNRDLKVLVATDVASRGIHVDEVSHVVNYDMPDNPEDYVHRIGRTGRAGHQGISIGFASEDDAFILPTLEKYLKCKLECTMPPEHLLL